MEGFDSEIDTEFSSGHFGGSSFFVAFSQKRLSTHVLAHSNKNPFHQGFLTGIATINLREFFIYSSLYSLIELSIIIYSLL